MGCVLNAPLKFDTPLVTLSILVSFKHEFERAFDFLAASEDVFLDICDFSLSVAFQVLLKCAHLLEQSHLVWEKTRHGIWHTHGVQIPLQLSLVDLALPTEALEVSPKASLVDGFLVSVLARGLFRSSFGALDIHKACRSQQCRLRLAVIQLDAD